MANHVQHDDEQHVPFENEATFIPDEEDIARREEADRQRHEADDHQLLIRIQQRQADAQALQARTNVVVAGLTFALVVVSLVGGFVSYLQFRAAKQSADAARTAAQIASATLKEIQKGGTDTHALAEAAKATASAGTQQVKLLRESNDINGQGLYTVQRAFISFVRGKFDFDVLGPNAFLQGDWNNTGNTSALIAWTRVHFEPTTARITQGFPFAFNAKDVITRFVLGPHATITFGSPVPKDTVHVYGPVGFFYGWVVYHLNYARA